MDDTISRQAVLNTVFSIFRRWDTENPDDLKNMLLLAFQELPTAPRWTPCSERLPKKVGDYLGTAHNGQIARYIYMGAATKDYWMRYVAAWMPLPEPYNGE